MAGRTLYDIIRDAADELGLPRPSSASAQDLQTRQLVALTNAACNDILQEHSWSILATLETITTVSGTSDYALPADFDRIIDDTEWDSTNHWRLVGPVTPQMDRALRESGLTWAGTTRFRTFGASFIRLWPTPTVDSQFFAYEYISREWGRDKDGNPRTVLVNDTDYTVFDPRLVIKALKRSFLNAKGFDSTAAQTEYLHTLNRRIADDIAAGELDMGMVPGLFTSEIAPGTINGGAGGSSGSSSGSGSGGSAGSGLLDADGFYIILE